MPRLCIVCTGICLKTDENHGKPSVTVTENSRLISAERDSFSRLGHRGRRPLLGCWPLPSLAFASGDGDLFVKLKPSNCGEQRIENKNKLDDNRC